VAKPANGVFQGILKQTLYIPITPKPLPDIQCGKKAAYMA
jgi:hypothetical protein